MSGNEENRDEVPDVNPEDEKRARAVHFTVSLVRLLGVVLLMLGIAIALDRLPPVPPVAGYVLVILGGLQMWIAPLWIIRSYVKARRAEVEQER